MDGCCFPQDTSLTFRILDWVAVFCAATGFLTLLVNVGFSYVFSSAGAWFALWSGPFHAIHAFDRGTPRILNYSLTGVGVGVTFAFYWLVRLVGGKGNLELFGGANLSGGSEVVVLLTLRAAVPLLSILHSVGLQQINPLYPMAVVVAYCAVFILFSEFVYGEEYGIIKNSSSFGDKILIYVGVTFIGCLFVLLLETVNRYLPKNVRNSIRSQTNPTNAGIEIVEPSIENPIPVFVIPAREPERPPRPQTPRRIFTAAMERRRCEI
jgi:hypothetical protein